MRRLGWASDTLKAGERITVVGWPAKNPARRALRPTAIKYNGSLQPRHRGHTVVERGRRGVTPRRGIERSVAHSLRQGRGRQPASNQGHSIGHWEGKSLVVDTTRFSENRVGNAYGLPSGPRKHLIERLTSSADGRSLTYHFELSDPEFMTAPVSGDVQWLYRPDTAYAPEKCNPEIARHYTQDK
jgi:hypothetical protein